MRKSFLISCFSLPLILIGCSSEKESPDTGAIDDGSIISAEYDKKVADSVEVILEGIEERTQIEPYRLPNGEVIERRVTIAEPIPPLEGNWEFLKNHFKETTGEVLLSFRNTTRPESILISDDGYLYIRYQEKLDRYQLNEMGAPDELLKEFTSTLQWNDEGKRILVTTGDEIREYSHPEWELIRSIPKTDIDGKIQYHPTDHDRLWVTDSDISFDANEQVRIIWSVNELGWDGKDPENLYQYRPLAAIGTLPLLKLAWALDLEFGQILPNSSPLWKLDESNGRLDTMLTHATSEVDFAAQGSLDQQLIYLRSENFPLNATYLSVRAWLTSLDSDTHQIISSEPTLKAAIAPSGKYAALVVNRDSEWKLVVSTVEDLKSQDLTQHEKELESVKIAMVQIASNLRDYYILLEETSKDEQNAVPLFSSEQMKLTAEAFREIVNQEGILTLTGDPQDLANLDQLIDLGHGIWEEEPAIVYALGAYYGQLLVDHYGMLWSLESASSSMSYNLQSITNIPMLGLEHSNLLAISPETQFGYFDFHSPFYTARERIDGNLHFSQAAFEAIRSTPYQTVLVENYGSFTLMSTLRLFLSLDGNPTTEILLNIEQLSLASYHEDYEAMTDVALNLALLHPEEPAFVTALGNALAYLGYEKEADELADQIVLMAPNMPQRIYQASRIYTLSNQYDKALETLDFLNKIDRFEAYLTASEEDREIIEELKNPTEENEN